MSELFDSYGYPKVPLFFIKIQEPFVPAYNHHNTVVTPSEFKIHTGSPTTRELFNKNLMTLLNRIIETVAFDKSQGNFSIIDEIYVTYRHGDDIKDSGSKNADCTWEGTYSVCILLKKPELFVQTV